VAVSPEAAAPVGDANPYAVISDRNVFRLNPPPPPPPPPEVKPSDLPQYKLTGIIKVGEVTRVLFALAPKDAKEQTTYLNLAAGERQGQLELVKINKEKEEVDVINSGTPMTLSVASNSFASAKGAAPAAAPNNPALRRLPGFPAPPVAPAAAAAEASPASSPGAIIIGGGGGDNNSAADTSGAANATPNNYAANFGGQSYGGGGSGVSVSGGASYGGSGYGAPGYGGITSPNAVPINLGGSAAPSGNVAARSWPPPEAVDPATQYQNLQNAAAGPSQSGVQVGGSGKTNPNLPTGGPPAPPIDDSPPVKRH
jgi:hypothetical protein